MEHQAPAAEDRKDPPAPGSWEIEWQQVEAAAHRATASSDGGEHSASSSYLGDEGSLSSCFGDNVIKKPSPLNKDDEDNLDCCQRAAVCMASRPCTFFWVSFMGALALSFIGVIVGDFSFSVDSAGWASRGTLIADRHTQFMLIDLHKQELWADKSGEVWDGLVNNVQTRWYAADDDDEDERRLLGNNDEEFGFLELGTRLQQGLQFKSGLMEVDGSTGRTFSAPTTANLPELFQRRLENASVAEGGILEGCDTSWYTSESLLHDTHLWPVWKISSESSSGNLLEASVLRELCVQEAGTQNYLVSQGLCFGCGEDAKRCLQPYSPVLFARLTVDNGLELEDCDALANAWQAYQEAMGDQLVACVEKLKVNYNPDTDPFELPSECPQGFFPTILNEWYDATERVQYATSIYATHKDDVDELFEHVESFSYGTENFEVAYDTQYEDFINIALNSQLLIDMSLAVGSAAVTAVAILVHTRSPFVTLVGLLQIILSFPISYFFYTFVFQLDFFPFLCFIGIFVIFALGADDVFVAVDKWKNARIENRQGTTAHIAAKALPDAAGAMLLTTLTTTIAFFGTAVCPVAPIRCFAIFCGLLVTFDYIMCILLVFPALCIYDAKRHVTNCCCRCHSCCKASTEDEDDEAEREHTSFIRRLLTSFYNGLHKIRWILFALCTAALIASGVFAAQLELPTSSDVRLYDEEDNQYEQNYIWRQNILYDSLKKQGGSSANVIWGVVPDDTGDLNNPSDWSQLVPDHSFEPSDPEAQVYLRDFCDRFFATEFAELINEDYVCPINKFDAWLRNQSALEEPDRIYTRYCSGATALPLPVEKFDICIYKWGQQYNEMSILAREGKIETMYITFNSRVRYDSPFDDLDSEWNRLEAWFQNDSSINAPASANKGYFTSEDFWWYDTNAQMLDTAKTSIAIALAAAASIILISSRSFVLTIFATLTVGYVLAAVVAMLVALGWTLGFLESILMAILIGISCDFVIHFSHAYSALEGDVSRSERTKHALIYMGPSILAAAATTFAAAIVMIATIITFFEKFAVVLFLTIAHSLLGSFIVFLTLADCIGPSHPTYLWDLVVSKCCARRCNKNKEDEDDTEDIGPTGHISSSDETSD